jgi:hypothetical protein
MIFSGMLALLGGLLMYLSAIVLIICILINALIPNTQNIESLIWMALLGFVTWRLSDILYCNRDEK